MINAVLEFKYFSGGLLDDCPLLGLLLKGLSEASGELGPMNLIAELLDELLLVAQGHSLEHLLGTLNAPLEDKSMLTLLSCLTSGLIERCDSVLCQL